MKNAIILTVFQPIKLAVATTGRLITAPLTALYWHPIKVSVRPPTRTVQKKYLHFLDPELWPKPVPAGFGIKFVIRIQGRDGNFYI
jgi:hypothetical protein